MNKSTKYSCEIQELKDRRKQALKSLKDIDYLNSEELAEFFYIKFKCKEDIPFDVLKTTPETEALSLPILRGGAIKTKKIFSIDPNRIKYRTSWTPGSTLTWHYHSDCNELIKVSEGAIKIYVEKQSFILKQGEEIEISQGVAHQITALTKAELSVEFFRI